VRPSQPRARMETSGNPTRLGWLVVLGCLLAGCNVVSTADSADDAKKWQGAWKLVATTRDPYVFKLDAGPTYFITRRRRGLLGAS
jgi:hypothetical protein